MGRLKLIFAILLFGCGVFASSPPTVPIVTVEEAKLSQLSDRLTYPARVESKVNSMIYAESDGVVTQILAPLGTPVFKGSRIAIVKHTDPIYQYAPMTLVSQVKGIVSQVAVTEGSAITKGSPIASVTDPSQVKILIEIAASDLSSFKKGMEGSFEISGATEKVPVRIKGVSPFVDPVTGAADCELVVDEKSKAKIPPGTVGQAYFEINGRKGFVFPESAIHYKGDDIYVRVVTNGVAKSVPVVLGRRERGKVEILKGVKDGDQVIERSSQFIADGDKVQVESGGG
jgi:multidrug efflux pump subunit AcrA (membrane-fusion protein)